MILAAFVVLVFAGSCAAAHMIALVASPDRTAGPFWASYVRRATVLLGLPGVLAALLPRGGPLSALWTMNLHAWADLTSESDWIDTTAIGLPVVVHLALLAVGSIGARMQRTDRARGLFGQAGFSRGRGWLAAAALPLLALVVANAGRLEARQGSYPRWLWVAELAVLCGLCGLAASPLGSGAAARDQRKEPVRGLADWPSTMRERGLAFETLRVIPPGEPAPAAHAASVLVTETGDALHPRVYAALEKLIHGQERGTFAPVLLRCSFDAGEAEVAIAASRLLASRRHEHCLLVAPRDAMATVRRLQAAARRVRGPGPRLPPELEVAEWTREETVAPDAPLWVVDAEVLAEHLLPGLARDSRSLQTIGCVIWWECHEYSGVYAANMWAVSRRLNRLLDEQGRRKPPVLVVVREPAGGADQLSRFLQWLLPYPFSAETTFVVQPSPRRALHVHLLADAQAALFQRLAPTGALREAGHPGLLCAMASHQAAWPTSLGMIRGVPSDDASNLLRTVGIDANRDLFAGPADAGVRIQEAEPVDVISFLPSFSEGGRLGPLDRPHHVALIAPVNPYLRYLLRSPPGTVRLGRRLVAAEATPKHMQRQLVHALAELPDTFHGLRRSFRWDEAAIRGTLDGLQRANRLTAEEVRFLDEGGRLVVDRLYRTPEEPGTGRVGLHVAQGGTFEVRELTADGATVRMTLDPERVAIAAYPGRVFFAGGKRFRVREEQARGPDLPREGYVVCHQDETVVTTERTRQARVVDLRAVRGYGEVRFGPRQELARQMVDVRYREQVTGRIELTRDLVDGTIDARPVTFTQRPLEADFETRALLLRVPTPPGNQRQATFASLARALQLVLPVHIAVDSDALAVIPVLDEIVRDTGGLESASAAGVVIVDLYPGGMGLIDAFHEDEGVILDLLRAVGGWVLGCTCKSDEGCPNCIAPPGIQAMRATAGASKRALKGLVEGLAPRPNPVADR